MLTDAHDAAPFRADVDSIGACVGALTSATADSAWWQCDGNRPDGAFACVRADHKAVEVVTDVFGSRTVWYVMTDRLFAASTSQRALVALLGTFEPDSEALTWMLWSGTLGPDLAWDARLRKAPPDAVVRLDRTRWALTVDAAEVAFHGDGQGRDVWEARLREAVEASVLAFRLDPARWPVTLSGGADSRGLAAILSRSSDDWWTATWGASDAPATAGSDAAVARKLADSLGLRHMFSPVGFEPSAAPAVLQRFVEAGEARLDHFPGVAGPTRALRDRGAWGVIRGDKVFGSSTAYSTRHARLRVGLAVPTDFASAPPGADALAPINVPERLRPRQGEALADYRDRVYTSFLLPSVVAALTAQKDPTLDTVNPYITRALAETVRRMPTPFRTDKALFRTVVEGYVPGVPFVSSPVGPALADWMDAPAFSAHVQDRLSGETAAAALPTELREALVEAAGASAVARRPEAALGAERSRALRKAVKRLLAHRAGAVLYAIRGRERPDLRRMAFRAALAVEAHEMFCRDATTLGDLGHGAPPRRTS